MTTADTVIIYDSDWNPQVDFQAIDRVHRIGQKKQVRVFRLITENTIDQRIIQRAEIKARLDRMVIQSSCNKENKENKESKVVTKKTGSTNKGILLDFIRFGAEIILSENKSDVNFDLKQLLAEAKAKEDAEKVKLDGMTLEQISSTSVYQFEGCDFRAKPSTSRSTASEN